MSYNNDVDIPKTNNYLSEQDLYALAKKRISIKKNFFVHLGVYSVVNLGILGINILTGPSYLWALFPILGWGMGLGAHYIATVASLRFDLKDTAIKKEIDYLKRNINGD
jgi:hypothetical protein